MVSFVNGKLVIPIGIGVAIIIVGIILGTSVTPNQEPTMEPIDIKDIPDNPIIINRTEDIDKNGYSPAQRDWQASGPFRIDRSEYVLGEKIFLVTDELGIDEKGQVAFLRPLNETHNKVYSTIPFDGNKKALFNYYVSPVLSSIAGICTTEDIIGEWTVVFRGTNYPNINFKIIDEILPGDDFSPVC